MTEPANVARLVFGNPAKGITNADGYNAAFTGKDNWDQLIDLPEITGRFGHDATVKENLWLEKHTGAIMLKPIISLDSMVGTGEGGTFVPTGAAMTGGSWKVKTISGEPELALFYQYDITATGWKVEMTSANALSANEGFMIYWEKYATPSGSSGDIVITLGTADATYIKLTISPRDEITVERNVDINNAQYDYEEKQKLTIPQSYYETETMGRMRVLTCMFVDDHVIIGINGLENTLDFKCEWCSVVDDSDGKQILQASAGGTLSVEADGACLIGLKELTYNTVGSFGTPLGFPGYIMTSAASFAYTQRTVLSGGGFAATTYSAGNDPTDESIGRTGRTGIEMFGVYARVEIVGSGSTSSLLYAFKIFATTERISQDLDPVTLSTDVARYEENMSGDTDGNFFGSRISAEVICTVSGGVLSHTNIFRSKAPQISHYLTLRDSATEVLRGVQILDIKEIGRPVFNKYDLHIESQDVTKRLRGNPMTVAHNFDDRIKENSWDHTDLMEALGDIGGVNVRSAAVDTDTHIAEVFQVLQASGDKGRPNWQFNRGTTIWQAMQRVRALSGWLLYPDTDSDNRDGLYYCPKPAGTETPKYSFNADTASVTNVRYKSTDHYKTRIFVLGKARQASTTAGIEKFGTDYSNKSWRYKKEQVLIGCAYDLDLEDEIADTRTLIITDPGYVDWLSIGQAVLRLYDYFTAEQVVPVFTINDFHNYQDLFLFDNINWVDDTLDHNGDKLMDSNFMITSMRLLVDKFTARADINVTIEEQAIINRLLEQTKRQNEGAMKDKNEFSKGLEAIANEDYLKLDAQSPEAIRIFAYKENDEEFIETRDRY